MSTGTRPRLVALDVDGTLLTSDHRITPAVAAAIRRVRADGVQVVLASSRPPRALWPILATLELVEPSVFIASQGALTGSYSGAGRLRVLDRRPMPRDSALRVVAAAARAGLSISWLAGERWLVPALDDPIRQEARIVGFQPEVADLAAEGEGPDKILLLSVGPRPDLPAALDLPADVVAEGSTPTHLEITRAGVDKATGLAVVCRELEIDPAEVVAMGDGRNDLALLELAGMAVAPGNAHPELLARADLVAPSNDDDSVAWMLDRVMG